MNRDLGLTIASAFTIHHPEKRRTEKEQLLKNLTQKYDLFEKIYRHFESGISHSLRAQTEKMVIKITEFMQTSATSDSVSQCAPLIPTSVVRHVFRMTDRDAVFDLIEHDLNSSENSVLIIRYDVSETTSIEDMRTKLIDELMDDHLLAHRTGGSQITKRLLHRIPFRSFAEAYAASHRKEDNSLPIVIMIEELEGTDSAAIAAFLKMLANNIHVMRFFLILGLCSDSSLNQYMSPQTYGLLNVKSFATESAEVMFKQVKSLCKNPVPCDDSFFKLGPECLQLLTDSFTLFDFSLEKILSIIKLMIWTHVYQKSAGSCSDEFDDCFAITDLYFANTRSDVISALKNPLTDRPGDLNGGNNGTTIDPDDDDDDVVLEKGGLDISLLYRQIASSSVSINMFDLMECLKSQKDKVESRDNDHHHHDNDDDGEEKEEDEKDSGLSPRKKKAVNNIKRNEDKRRNNCSKRKINSNNNNEDVSDKSERSRFFTLINDMSYTGILQKDRRRTGRLTKVVWE